MAQQSSLLSIIGTSGVLLVGSRCCSLCPARAVVVRRSLGFTRTTGAHTLFIRELNPRDRLFGKVALQNGDLWRSGSKRPELTRWQPCKPRHAIRLSFSAC